MIDYIIIILIILAVIFAVKQIYLSAKTGKCAGCRRCKCDCRNEHKK